MCIIGKCLFYQYVSKHKLIKFPNCKINTGFTLPHDYGRQNLNK